MTVGTPAAAAIAVLLFAACGPQARAESVPPVAYEIGNLHAFDGISNDRYGIRVATSDAGFVVIGATGDDDLASLSGSAYLYEQDPTGGWRAVKLLASDGDSQDEFGLGISASGRRVVVGAWKDDDLGLSSGSAYVFERSSAGGWTEVAKLLPSDGAAKDWFGAASAISGDTVAVGADYHDHFALQSGAVYLFEPDASGRWRQVAELLPGPLDTTSGSSLFGASLAMSGDTLVVGASHDDDQANGSGAAYVYERDPDGAWVEVAKLLPSDGGAFDSFGRTVAVSGETVVVGSPSHDDPALAAGAAYVFERSSAGSWIEVARLQPSDSEAHQSFGGSVALAGDRLVVGAYNDDQSDRDAGAAYLFVRDPSGRWNEVVKFLASDGLADDALGLSVAFLGDLILAGAYKNDDLGMDSGSVYFFSLGDL